MAVFVFSSSTLTNVWAGIGAGLWVVSKSRHEAVNKGRASKSSSMKIGTFGILYCVETQSLTTPFIVFSETDRERSITNVWPEEWVLPFRMHPLGTPRKQLHKNGALDLLPSFKAGGVNFTDIVNVQPITVFSPSRLTEQDWEVLIAHLAEGATTGIGIPDFDVLGL